MEDDPCGFTFYFFQQECCIFVIGKAPGVGTGDGSGVVSGTDGSANFGLSGSSSATPNSAWSYGCR
jgi:hypothetical protein